MLLVRAKDTSTRHPATEKIRKFERHLLLTIHELTSDKCAKTPQQKKPQLMGQCSKFGGSGEIRTHEQFNPSLVFKTSAFNHSATLPEPALYIKLGVLPMGEGMLAANFPLGESEGSYF